MQGNTARKAPPTAWRVGQSGNPAGKPKRKPITSMMLKAWNEQISGTDKRIFKDAVRLRLINIILKGDEKRSLDALKLLWSYFEGQPQASVEIQFDRALEEIAARTGAPKMWLVKRSREIQALHGADGVDQSNEAPEPPAEDRVRSVRRQHAG